MTFFILLLQNVNFGQSKVLDVIMSNCIYWYVPIVDEKYILESKTKSLNLPNQLIYVDTPSEFLPVTHLFIPSESNILKIKA